MIGLKSDLIGTWKFTVNSDAFTVDPYKMDSVCTHKLPNLSQLVRKGEDLEFGDDISTGVVTIEFKESNTAFIYGSKKEGKPIEGNWTMINN
jgi:hypothetical protein